MIPLLLWMALAPAAVVEPTDGPCAVGDGPVRVFTLVSQNTHGGWDSDGARYSSGEQFRTYALATCPGNLLTLYGDDMRSGLTEAEQAALAPVLDRIRSEIDDPRALTTPQRYVLAARAYEALGRSHRFLARVYLQGAWTIRDRAVGFHPDLDGPLAARTVLRAGEQAVASAEDAAQERLVLLNLARVAHRGGYATERDRWLDRLEARSDLGPEEQAAARTLRRAPAAEGALLDRSIDHLQQALEAGEGTTAQQLEATYLLGDLQRRRGRTQRALARYDAVIAHPEVPEALRGLAAYLAAELRGEMPWEGLDPDALGSAPIPD